MRILCFALLLFGSVARANVEDCTANGKDVNLNNGATTEHLTGTVKCVDRATRKPTREVGYRNGKQHGMEKIFGTLTFDGEGKWHEYVDGKRTGCAKVFFRSGKLKEDSCLIENGKRVEKKYYESGKLAALTRGEDESRFRLKYTEAGKLSDAICGAQVTTQAGRNDCVYPDQNGTVKFYRDDGSVEWSARYSKGLFDGDLEEFDQDGKMSSRQHFKAGKLEGTSVRFAQNGKPVEEITFAQNKKKGPERHFFKDGGQLELEMIWDGNGKVTQEKVFYQNGQLRTETTRQGEAVVAKGFWDSGKPRFEGAFRERVESADTGSFWFFTSSSPFYSGTLSYLPWGGFTKSWRSLEPVGLHRSFYENGQPSEEENYVDGKRHGAYKEYSEQTGKLREESVYEQGRLAKKKEYDDSGKVTLDEEYFPDGSRKKKK